MQLKLFSSWFSVEYFQSNKKTIYYILILHCQQYKNIKIRLSGVILSIINSNLANKLFKNLKRFPNKRLIKHCLNNRVVWIWNNKQKNSNVASEKNIYKKRQCLSWTGEITGCRWQRRIVYVHVQNRVGGI